MRKYKKILAVFVCVIMIVVSFTISAGAYSEQDGFLYEFIDNSDVIEIIGISPTGQLADQQTISLPYSIRGVAVIQIGKSAFSTNSTIKNMEMTENILQISDDAMYRMTNLQNITLPKYLMILGKRAFAYCTALESVNFETEELKQLQEFTFYGCTRLNNVILSPSVLELEDYCFGHCMSLDKIYIPSSVAKISQTAFYSTKSGQTIYGEAGSVAYRYALENNISFVDISNRKSEELFQAVSSVDYWRNHTNISWYTQDSITALTTAYDNAVVVSENFFSLPEEVSTALDNLNNAYRSLRLKSMEELDSLIIQAENYSPVFFQYTESSFNELENALLQAKEVQQKELPSEREVQSAKKNLNDSISALQQVMKYDVNNDGKITLSDIISVQRWLISDYSLTQRNIYIADFNNDGVITLTDVILFQRYLLRN